MTHEYPIPSTERRNTAERAGQAEQRLLPKPQPLLPEPVCKWGDDMAGRDQIWLLAGLLP